MPHDSLSPIPHPKRLLDALLIAGSLDPLPLDSELIRDLSIDLISDSNRIFGQFTPLEKKHSSFDIRLDLIDASVALLEKLNSRQMKITPLANYCISIIDSSISFIDSLNQEIPQSSHARFSSLCQRVKLQISDPIILSKMERILSHFPSSDLSLPSSRSCAPFRGTRISC